MMITCLFFSMFLQIGNVNTVVNKPAAANSTTTPAPTQAQVVVEQTKPVQAPAKPSITKISSVKPPPPSTKIPKSAVVMPDGTSNSTKFNLDVQFGCDFDSLRKWKF